MSSTVWSFRRCEAFFCPPFLKLLFATDTRCSGKEGEWWGVGLLLCILRGGFFLGFRDGEAFFLFPLAHKLGLKRNRNKYK